MQTIILNEYEPSLLPAGSFSPEIGELLWQNFGYAVDIDSPSFKTDNQWRLKSLGWVGQIPLTNDCVLNLLPKVPISNLFGMWEYAYRLKSFRFLEGLVGCDSLNQFYDSLAKIMARKILDRVRKGIYRCYLTEEDTLPFLRGRINLQHYFTRPWDTRLNCCYDTQTGDIDDNKILAWTLFVLARSGQCRPETVNTVRAAYRALQGLVTPSQYKASSCTGRQYNRLNEDYRPLHALCRFFLANTGPTYRVGDKEMLPFLVSMPRLFEAFIAEWLKANLPSCWNLRIQEHMGIDREGKLEWIADLVIYDAESGKPYCILDTKYKNDPRPDPDDIAKVTAYAQLKGCKHAALVYPAAMPMEINQNIGNIRVRSLSFSLDGNLEDNGRTFLTHLFESCCTMP